MRQMSFSEMITYSTVLIKCRYKDGSTGSGTGFIMDLCLDDDNKMCIPVIITNKHVVNNYDKCEIDFCLKDDNGAPIDTKVHSVTYENRDWIYHPNDNVDLCCLPLAEALRQIELKKVKIFYIPLQCSLIPTDEIISQMTALENIVMIGYPIGLSDNYNHKPIIRRGTTATHYKNNYNGNPEVLLDIACHPGSSGSPIFILDQGMYKSGSTLHAGDRILLVGVLYGGIEQTLQGELKLYKLPTLPVPVVRTSINLGIAVKANEILEFEKILKPISKNTQA